jgi:hypothetical protein
LGEIAAKTAENAAFLHFRAGHREHTSSSLPLYCRVPLPTALGYAADRLERPGRSPAHGKLRSGLS